MHHSKLLLIFCSFCCVTRSARILGIFNYHSTSHSILGRKLLEALAQRGQWVTMMSPFPAERPIENYEDIVLRHAIKYRDENLPKVFQKNEPASAIEYLKILSTQADACLQDPAIQDLLKSDRKFDLIIQIWGYNEAFLGLAHHFNASVVGFVPIGGLRYVDYQTGSTSPFSYVPATVTTLNDDMTFLQRFQNIWTQIKMSLRIWYDFYPYQQEMLEKYFPSAPPLEELMDKVDLVLVNSHFSTESPRPYVPNLIQIGGFHIEESQELGDDLKEILGEATDGVVYMNLGSNVESSNLPEEKLEAFAGAFGRTKLRVLWKLEEQFPAKPTNVELGKWYPQMGVLAHPSTNIFITHGSYGSMHESLYFGVPLICIPFFSDQQRNCFDAVHRGFAIQLGIDDISEEVLLKAINDVLHNKTYKKNAQFRSQLFRDQPIKPLDRAIFWIEYVMKHKTAKHLKPLSTKLRWHQYLLLDVMAFVLVSLAVTVIVVSIAFAKLLRIFFIS